MKKLSVFIAIIFMLNCKQEPTASLESIVKVVEDPELILNMEFKTNKEDVLIVSLNEIKVDEFQSKSIHVSEKVIPTTASDHISVNFGPNNLSRKLVIDLGSKELKEFEIVSLSFQYKDNIVEISPNEIEHYFALSKFSELDKATNKIKTQKVEGIHFPKLYLRGIIWDELLK